MNKVELIGRLTKDPDVKTAQNESGTTVARYTLAVDRKGRSKGNDEQTADFISVVAFGSSGDFASRYLKKGLKIAVVGHIQTGSYTNKDGVRVYTTDVVAEDQEFVESKGSSAPENAAEASPSFVDIPDEEMPFK